MRKGIGCGAAIALLTLGMPGISWAQEASGIRPYIALRTSLGSGGAIFAEPDSGRDVELESPAGEALLGATVGFDWNRYWGAEFSADFVETTLEQAGTGQKIGEYALWTALAQLRLRYPLLRDRLVPYALLGGGVGIGEINDSNIAYSGPPVGGNLETSPVGAVGGGIEYFVARNIAVGLEAKYRFGFENEIEFAGARRDLTLDSLAWSAGMRVYFDEQAPDAPPPADSAALRGYLALRAGGGAFTSSNDSIVVELSSPAAPAAAAAVGLNLNKYLGFEVSADTIETDIKAPGVGTLGEYTVVAAAAQARLRYPIMDDRLSPYLLVGGGMGFGEYNDRKIPQSEFRFDANRSYSPLAVLGAGIEYFLADNIALGVEAKEVFLFDGDLEIEGQQQSLDQDVFFLTVGIRVFFP